jgi:hypothetical protein
LTVTTLVVLLVLPLFFLSTSSVTLVCTRLANDAKSAQGGRAPFGLLINVYCKALKSDSIAGHY